jgi:hypothetical protein
LKLGVGVADQALRPFGVGQGLQGLPLEFRALLNPRLDVQRGARSLGGRGRCHHENPENTEEHKDGMIEHA